MMSWAALFWDKPVEKHKTECDAWFVKLLVFNFNLCYIYGYGFIMMTSETHFPNQLDQT